MQIAKSAGGTSACSIFEWTIRAEGYFFRPFASAFASTSMPQYSADLEVKAIVHDVAAKIDSDGFAPRHPTIPR